MNFLNDFFLGYEELKNPVAVEAEQNREDRNAEHPVQKAEGGVSNRNLGVFVSSATVCVIMNTVSSALSDVGSNKG